MEPSLSASSSHIPQRYPCPDCKQETWTTAGDPACEHCGRLLKAEFFASAILAPAREQMDETLTAYLAAPLPEEVLRKTGNPANLFGKYVFLREIGRGATGRVIKAWDTYLSRHVALKFLHDTASRNIELDDTQRVQDFLREARLAARLQHPNIVPVHEVDCRDGRYYISMEFIDGATLAERIHGPMEDRVRTHFYHQPKRFLELLRTISLAVHHAHRQNPPVVHRDLKPQNVLIDAQDKPYVADFGLANEVQVSPSDGNGGGIRGTPAYMAPEQALGRSGDIDPRTDVYSLGIILYEMLTGEPPFKGSNIPSVLRKIATDDPEPPVTVVERLLKNSPEVAACPTPMRAALEGICLKALAKNRGDRYASALEFADALGTWTAAAPTDSGSPSLIPASLKPRAGFRMALLGSLLLALISFVPRLRAPSEPPAPVAGDDLATLAAAYRSAGQWSSFQSTVATLRQKAPDHPHLRELEAASSDRDSEVGRRRLEWIALLDRITRGLPMPGVAELQRRLREYPEIEDDLRNDLRRILRQREATLLSEIQEIASSGPGNAWTSPETKARAAEIRSRIELVRGVSGDPTYGIDFRPLDEGSALLDRVLAYQGTWSLRINVSPYAEFRVLEGEIERGRDFTPALLKELEVGRPNARLELCWPSLREPKLRWSAPVPALKPGHTLVISGDLQKPELTVERP